MKSRLLLTLTHAAGDQIKSMIANIRKGIDYVIANAPEFPKTDRWRALVPTSSIKSSRPSRKIIHRSVCLCLKWRWKRGN